MACAACSGVKPSSTFGSAHYHTLRILILVLIFQFDGLTHPDGSPYKATTAWKDLFATLQAAEKFIYITGWSVFTKIELVRGEDDRHVLEMQTIHLK